MTDSEPVTFTTADGCTLVGDLTIPSGVVHAAAVVCHPHPLYGGDRRNSVVDALFRALPEAGMAAVRFDFRGVGQSTGVHGEGAAEAADVAAAIDLLSGRCGTAVPMYLTGYSFGAAVALGVLDARVAGWVGVAAPLSTGS